MLDGEYMYIVWKVDWFGFVKIVGLFIEIFGLLILDEDDLVVSLVMVEIVLSGLWFDYVECEEIMWGLFWLDVE